MGEFLSYIGFIFTKIYQVLDFKILGFPISVIHIILGTLAFGAFITFLRNISGIVGTSTDGIKGLITYRNNVRSNDTVDTSILREMGRRR